MTQWYDRKDWTGKQIGYFRTCKSPDAAKRALDGHSHLSKSDERCRHEVKKKHVRGPCGVRAMRCIRGVWYCKRHADIVEKQIAVQDQTEAP